jgi:hypothetical protein
MKKLTISFFLLFMSGCATTSMPNAPTVLLQPCPETLKTIDPNTTELDQVLSVVVSNYGEYHKCRIKTDAWIDWYNRQQAINK